VFSVVVGGFFYWTSLMCVNQATVQKAMSLRNLTKAKISLTIATFGLGTVFLVNFYTGLMAFAHYQDCDPLAAGLIDGIDQLMPFFVMDTFGHIKFFVGIFVAG
jgi:solute carrier family 5 (sodium-coupled monocarboxylate transporter), member 8/12